MTAFVESEAGKNIKNRFNEDSFEFVSSEFTLAPYPYSYGFIIGTNLKDRDCIDCYIISNRILSLKEKIECDVLGMIEFLEGDEIDYKAILKPKTEDVLFNEEIIMKIKSFIRTIFQKFPDIKVDFGKTYSKEETTKVIETRIEEHKGSNSA